MAERSSQTSADSTIVVTELDRRWWATPVAVLVLASVLLWGPGAADRGASPVAAARARSGGGALGGTDVGPAAGAGGEEVAFEASAATEPGLPDIGAPPVGVAGGPAFPEAGAAAGAGTVAGGGVGATSHCTQDGRQHPVVFHAPPCVPRWAGGDNGGTTAPGVTATTISVVVLHEKYDAALNAAYAAAGYELASRQEILAADQAAAAHLNRRLELYGRRIEVRSVFTECGYPEDIPRCRESVREVIAAKPFAVVFPIGSYSVVFDDFARAGILTFGGHWFDDAVYARNRPYLHSARPSGSRALGHVAEYGCKKLAGRPADRAGSTIHQTIGARGKIRRQFGLMVPEDPSAVAAGRALQAAIAACDGGRVPVLATYTNDVATAAAQVNSIALRFIAAGVTTVVPWNTSSANFLAAEASRQRWYPEWIVTGVGRMDEDENGQRMDRAQWQHAFGPAMSGQPQRFDRSDSTAVWRDAGKDGLPHEDTDRGTADFLVLGWALQGAGPRLTAERAAAALDAAGARGGAGAGGVVHPSWSFGPGDRTGADDAREVWFDVAAPSPVNGKPGTYRTVGAGRIAPGRWGSSLDVPVASS